MIHDIKNKPPPYPISPNTPQRLDFPLAPLVLRNLIQSILGLKIQFLILTTGRSFFSKQINLSNGKQA